MAINQIAKGRSLLKGFVISEVSGEVLESSESSRTEIKTTVSGGGTTAVHGGVAMNSPVQAKVTTETTDFQTIFIKSDDGIETVVETENMTFPLRVGHRVSLWRLGKKRWIKAYNHSTDQEYWCDDLWKILYPKFLYFFLGLLIATNYAIASGTSGIVYATYWFVFFLVGLAIAMIPCAFIWRRRKRAIDAAIKKNSPSLAA